MKKRSLLLVLLLIAVLAVGGFWYYKSYIGKDLKTDVVAVSSFTLLDPTDVKVDTTKHASSTPTLQAGEILYFTANMNFSGTPPADGSIKRSLHAKFSTTANTFSSPAKTLSSYTTIGKKAVSDFYYTDNMLPDTYYLCVQLMMNNDNSIPTGDYFNVADQKTNCVASSDSFTIVAANDPAACFSGVPCFVSDGKTKCQDTTAVKCYDETDTIFTCRASGYTCTQYCAVGSTCPGTTYVCKSGGQRCLNPDGTVTCYQAGATCPTATTTTTTTTTTTPTTTTTTMPTTTTTTPTTTTTTTPTTTTTTTPTTTTTTTPTTTTTTMPTTTTTATATRTAEEDGVAIGNPDGNMPTVDELAELDRLTAEVDGMIGELEVAQEKLGTDERIAQALENLKNMSREARGSRQLLGGARLVSAVIMDAREENQEIIEEVKTENNERVVSTAIAQLEQNVAKVKEFSDKNVSDDKKVAVAVSALETTVSKIREAESKGEKEAVMKLVDEANRAQEQLSKWLKPVGFTVDQSVKVADAVIHTDDAVAKKVDELSFKFAVMMDEKLQPAAIKLAELSSRFSDQFSRRVAQAVNNVTAIKDQTKRQKIAEVKSVLLDKIKEIDAALAKAKLNAFTVSKLRSLLEEVATVNWCGDQSADIQVKVSSLSFALTAGELGINYVNTFESDLMKASKANIDGCYKDGVSSFKMATHEWYYPDAEWNAQNGYMKGYKDTSGKATGDYGEGNPTLRIEALVIMNRIFGVVDGDRKRTAVPGTPDWGIGPVNGAKAAGVAFDWNLKMDQPISRIETAELIAGYLKAKGFVKELPEAGKNVQRYTDAGKILADKKRSKAVELLTDYGIFQGSTDGSFYPNNSLVRSEFGALNRRIVESFGLQAIGNPDGN